MKYPEEDIMTFSAKNYWEERLRKDYNLRGVGHLGLGKHYNWFLYAIRRRLVRRVLRNMDLKFDNLRALDIGSGTGFYVELLEKLGVKDITGLDISNVAIQELKKKYSKYRFSREDIGDNLTQVGDESYDLVTSFDVLFHIVEDSRYECAFENVYSLLNPGGYFIFSEGLLRGRRITMKHVVFRSMEEVERIINKTGFEMVKHIPMFVYMGEPIDSDNIITSTLTKIILKVVSYSELAGMLIGGLLFPLETLLIRVVRNGPSTKIVVCRKSNENSPRPYAI